MRRDDDDQDEKKTYYTVVKVGSVAVAPGEGGRYASARGPAAAAAKAASRRFGKASGSAVLRITMRQLGTQRHFAYQATRERLAKPVVRTVVSPTTGNTATVSSKYKTDVKAIKCDVVASTRRRKSAKIHGGDFAESSALSLEELENALKASREELEASRSELVSQKWFVDKYAVQEQKLYGQYTESWGEFYGGIEYVANPSPGEISLLNNFLVNAQEYLNMAREIRYMKTLGKTKTMPEDYNNEIVIRYYKSFEKDYQAGLNIAKYHGHEYWTEEYH
jgi:hypothetical protein